MKQQLSGLKDLKEVRLPWNEVISMCNLSYTLYKKGCFCKASLA